MSQNLKTSHSQEHQIYRGMGGSIARFGMGDNDRASGSMRGVFEGKLQNRSLVLIGGGVHGRVSEKNDADAKEMSLVGLGAAASTSKRERKRVGGNGVFGSISNKKRKRLLRQLLENQRKRGKDYELKMHDKDYDGDEKKTASQTQKEQPKIEKTDKREQRRCNASPVDVQGEVGRVVETMLKMWISYSQQLIISPIKRANNLSTSTDSSSSLALEDRKQISLSLATAEHVGMPAAIVECTSRRHLVDSRCVIVDETRETWKIAMIKNTQKRYTDNDKRKEKKESNSSNQKINGTNNSSTPFSYSWKVVMVPKRGTVLKVDIPWDECSVSDGCSSPSWPTKSYVTVRLKT